MKELELFNRELIKLYNKKERGDIEEIVKETRLTRNTIYLYLKGLGVNTRTASKILVATRKIINNRTKDLIPNEL